MKRTREQHFVPEVYTKAWKTDVVNKKEPDKIFRGVYVFENGETVGNGFNNGSVLWKPHLYTVGYEYIFITQSCPKILTCFIDQVYEMMLNNKPKPVFGKFGHSIIKTKQSVRKHLQNIEEWDFYYYDGNSARTASIIKNIAGLNCYIIENAFDDNFEKHWEGIYQRFINEVHNGKPVALGKSERIIAKDAAIDMIEFFFMMLCRSPKFDAMGIFTQIRERILSPVLSELPSAEDQMMRGIWLSELYKIFFKKSGGFYHNIIATTLEGCQMILFEAYNDAGMFITSDNPSFQNTTLAVECINSTGFIFPITPKFLLFIGKGDHASIDIVDHRFANSDTIRHFNKLVDSNKTSLLISCEKLRDRIL